MYEESWIVFFFKQKTAYEMRISDWSSDVCSSDLGREALRLLDCDDALIADLLHGFSENAADFSIAIGRYGGDLGDLAVGADLLGMRSEILDHGADRQIDAALQVHRVHAGGHRLRALAHDRLGEHSGRGGSVTRLRSEEHTSELQSLMRISYAVFCLKKKKQ